MAGDWIPFTKDLPEKLEVLRLAEVSNRPVAEVVLALLRFWAWADSHSTDGLLRHADVTLLSHVCSGTDASFWRHVVDVGWLSVEEGGLRIPNFEFWMSKSAKKRLCATRRQRNRRQGLTGEPGSRHADVTLLSRAERDKVATTEQNSTEQEIPPLTLQGGSGETPPPSDGKPTGKRDAKVVAVASDPAFLRFWEAYPRKVSKIDAQRAWLKLAPDPGLVEKILRAVAAQAKSEQWRRDGGQYIPYPATWLSGRRWEDDVAAAGSQGPPVESVEDIRQRQRREADEVDRQRREASKARERGAAS